MRKTLALVFVLMLAGQTAWAADTLGALQAKRHHLRQRLIHLNVLATRPDIDSRKLNCRRNLVLSLIRDTERRMARERQYVARAEARRETIQVRREDSAHGPVALAQPKWLSGPRGTRLPN